MEQGPRYLLLLDNVLDPSLLAAPIRTKLLPSNDKVHLIVTSILDPKQFPRFECLSLKGLIENDATNLLEKYRHFTSNVEREARPPYCCSIRGICMGIRSYWCIPLAKSRSKLCWIL